jgi:hypothetical protein
MFIPGTLCETALFYKAAYSEEQEMCQKQRLNKTSMISNRYYNGGFIAHTICQSH